MKINRNEKIIALYFFLINNLFIPIPTGHDTDPMDTNRPKYRPLFLEHFEKKEVNHLNTASNGTLTNLRLSDDNVRFVILLTDC